MKFITIMTVTSYVTIFRALIYFLSVMAKRVMEKHPLLARQENENNHTPMHLAANEDKVDELTALLEQDRSLGYLISTDGAPLLCIAASHTTPAPLITAGSKWPSPPVLRCVGFNSTVIRRAITAGSKPGGDGVDHHSRFHNRRC